jgi:Holliday junction resolvase-like predicted endonuclease
MSKNEISIERNALVQILKLTKDGSAKKELIGSGARIPQQVANRILKKVSDMELIQLKDETVEASPSQRIQIAVHAVELGADFEDVCKALNWDEFENIASLAFEVNGFTVLKHLRFKWAGRRWENDILGYKEPLIVCAECKHWLHGWHRSTITKAVESQVSRTHALAESFPLLSEKLRLIGWKKATLVPMVLSLVPAPFKLYNKVPIVPILQLQSFLGDLPAYITSLRSFSLRIS